MGERGGLRFLGRSWRDCRAGLGCIGSMGQAGGRLLVLPSLGDPPATAGIGDNG